MRGNRKLARLVRKHGGYLFIAPAMLLLFLVTLYPVLRTLQLSLSRYNLQTFAISWGGFGNFSKIFKDAWFWISIKNTLIFTVGSVLLHGLMAWVLGLLINRPWKWNWCRDTVRGFWILPWLFSNAAAALMWGLLFHPFGILNYLLTHSGLGLEPIDFLGNPRVALFSLILVNVWKTYPIYLVLLLGAFQAIPRQLLEAARVEGAGFLQELRFVILPLVLPAVLTMTMLDFITTFGHFDLVRMMTGGGPMRATETLSYYIYRTAFKAVDFPYSSSLSVVMFLVLALCSYLYVRAYIRSSVFGSTL